MKIYLIDGYNLLHKAAHAMPEHLDLHGQREHLIRLLSTFSSRQHCQVTVVFDNRSERLLPSSRQRSFGLEIIFTRPGQEADQLIQQKIRRHAHPADLTIVSSDNEIRYTAKDHGCQSVTSQDFLPRILSGGHSGKPGSLPSHISDKYDTDLSQEQLDYWKSLFEQGPPDEDG